MAFDLRKHCDRAPSMVALISSYLFGPHPVHLNDLYFRPDDSTHQWWTLPHVPGERYEDKPVYLLASKRTFSAAEKFTYNLKSLKRATIVGETTGGGAHPGGTRRINEHFAIFVPSGRAILPRWSNSSKRSWPPVGPRRRPPATVQKPSQSAPSVDSLEPLPAEWNEGRRVIVEDADLAPSEELGGWFRKLQSLGPAEYEPGE